jgi:8-oxo-dGTP pyrophosphatase MutT (NUDIX family)
LDAAVREVWEETGYTVEFKEVGRKEVNSTELFSKNPLFCVSPPLVTNPHVGCGLSNYYTLEVNGDSPQNKNPITHNEIAENEHTEAVLVNLDENILNSLRLLVKDKVILFFLHIFF